MMAVDFAPGSPPHIGRPHVLFEFAEDTLPFVCAPMRCYDVAPDGQRFYSIQVRTPPRPPVVTHINLILNWAEELKAKVPTGRRGRLTSSPHSIPPLPRLVRLTAA